MLRPQEGQRVGGLLPGGIRIQGLSGGEKRRLSLCCGSITKPDILFADEPTSGECIIYQVKQHACPHAEPCSVAPGILQVWIALLPRRSPISSETSADQA